MDAIGIGKVFGTFEKCLQAFFGPGNDSRIVAKEQSAQHGYQYDGEKIGFRALVIIHHVCFLVDICSIEKKIRICGQPL
ncbi:MAG: hypothetical protein ACOCOT_00415 [Prevotella sp.]